MSKSVSKLNVIADFANKAITDCVSRRPGTKHPPAISLRCTKSRLVDAMLFPQKDTLYVRVIIVLGQAAMTSLVAVYEYMQLSMIFSFDSGDDAGEILSDCQGQVRTACMLNDTVEACLQRSVDHANAEDNATNAEDSGTLDDGDEGHLGWFMPVAAVVAALASYFVCSRGEIGSLNHLMHSE